MALVTGTAMLVFCSITSTGRVPSVSNSVIKILMENYGSFKRNLLADLRAEEVSEIIIF